MFFIILQMDFTENLLHWYREHKRDLPWRNTSDPYYIWLSEIILQQTRIEQGLPYYQSFTQNFPTLKDLATSDEDRILKLWQGLGYYSRARNLHHTAKTIYFDLGNRFPSLYKEILSLKGIGPYTAAAIASFAFKEPVGVVDGNVFRVVSRFFGIYDDISLPRTRTVFQDLVNELISKEHPDLFNHALMDFGATVCTPANPKCTTCVLSTGCVAFLNNDIKSLPVKTKKTAVKNRYLNYLIIRSNDRIAIQQRTSRDIWQQLYELPLVETAEGNEEVIHNDILKKYPSEVITKINEHPVKHKLSHQQLYINFYEVEGGNTAPLRFVAEEELSTYAYPVVVWNFLKDFFTLEKN